uniref:Uncharacterized protein n=1 Tax=Anguilla anguilla TaxID=7936 RepID=A0A0E9WE77_ANGAN
MQTCTHSSPPLLSYSKKKKRFFFQIKNNYVNKSNRALTVIQSIISR